MNIDQQDRLFSNTLEQIDAFAFNDDVAQVFSDMIRRSVPGYGLTLSMLGVLARQHVTDESSVYDLGCSLGAGIFAMREKIKANSVTIIGVDTSDAMLSRCRDMIEKYDSPIPVELVCGDVRTTPINNASMAVMNFTLQFIPRENRLALLTRIHDGMKPGGVLVLSEKIAFDDEVEDRFQIDMHHAFKRTQGYSDLEISQKRTALENVLIPESIDVHHERLKDAGFSHSYTWFQCFNFSSIIAIKH